MNKAYFKSKLIKVSVEPKEIREQKVVKSGFLCLKKTISEQVHFEDEYFIFVKFDNADFLLKIKVSKKDFDRARVGDDVSVMLKFEFDFACFHFSIAEEVKEYVIEAEERN